MAFPKRNCSICSQEFELRPDKPGFASRYPVCTEEDNVSGKRVDKTEPRSDRELTSARRKAMRDLLYRKGS